MPIYEYRCTNCKNEIEVLQSIKDAPLTKCPECGKNTLQKMVSGGAGLIFKGSGFYLTDYKKKSTEKSSQSDKIKSITEESKADIKKSEPKLNKKNQKHKK